MISISSLFRFLFIFSVVTVAGVGFFSEDPSFLSLAAINALLLLLIGMILRFTKSAAPIVLTKKDKKAYTEDLEQARKEDSDDANVAVSSKSTSHAHHHQFVKYTYNHKKKKKSLSIVWIVALLLVVVIYGLMNRPTDTKQVDSSLSGYSQDILNQNDSLSGNSTSGEIITITGEVLASGLSEAPATGIVVDKSFVTTGETPKTTTPTTTEAPKALSNSTLKIANTQSVSLLEAIVYLLQTHNTSLYSKKDLTFAGITTKNPYYKYWYTAYKMGLVGNTSSPSTLISCQTYIVLKGMIEKWDVQYTSANVKTQYWAEGEKRDVLNGCVFGKLLKGANLD